MEPAVAQRIWSAVQARYGLTQPEDVRPLRGALWNEVFAFRSAGAECVLRISHSSAAPQGVEQEHQLMAYMARMLPEVPAPIPTREGATYLVLGGRIISVFPRMPGLLPDRSEPVVQRAASRMLARLHQAARDFTSELQRPGYVPLRDLDWSRNRMWDWEHVDALLSGSRRHMEFVAGRTSPPALVALHEILSRRDQIRAERDAFQAWVGRVRSQTRHLIEAPIHGDYYARNLLMQDEQISAVLDWEDCQREWLVWELARATWEFCQDDLKHTLITHRARAFVEAYVEAGGPVLPEEFDLIIPLMRCIRLIEVLYALGDALRGEKWFPVYAVHNLRSLDNLLAFRSLA